tara:strand:- start:604 stop:1215 length:612 start_codon:yes stop_codon:yes gene_type:complete
MPGSIKIDDGSGNYTILTNAGSLGSDKTITIPNETATLATTNGITEYDQWQLVNSTAAGANGDISGTWSRFNHAGTTYIGTGMSVSSGVFTFPSTGKWEVVFTARIANTDADDQLNVTTEFTSNNSSYSSVAIVGEGSGAAAASRGTGTSFVLLDITDTSNCKVKFEISSASANTYVFGNNNPSDTSSGYPQTYAIFKRLGDT